MRATSRYWLRFAQAHTPTPSDIHWLNEIIALAQAAISRQNNGSRRHEG
jgi:hypothetical protein